MDLARLHPEINYVGIEMYDSVLLRALQKREELEEKGEVYSNLFFIHWNMFVICFFDQRNIFNKLHPHIGSRYNCSQMTDNTRPYLQRISVKPHNLRKMKLSTLTSTILLHIPLCHL